MRTPRSGRWLTGLAWLGGTVWAVAQTATNARPAATNLVVKPLVWRGTNSWLTFGLDRVEGLDRDILGIPLWQYAASAIYVVLAFYLAKAVDWLVTAYLKRRANRTPAKYDTVIADTVHGPIKVLLFVALLHIGLTIIQWPPRMEKWIALSLHLVVACALTYLALKTLQVSLDLWKPQVFGADEKYFREQLLPIVRNFLRIFILIVAGLLTCQNLGLDITSLLASLSIGGLAIGLAAQDTLANFFGAIAVFLDKPFRVGDRIKLDSVDGTVETIGLRSTRVRNGDGHLVTIPNKTMGNATIINVTRRPNIRTEMNFGLTYDTSHSKLQQALAILEEIYKAHPCTADLVVGFNKFADSSLNILLVHNWNGNDYKEYVAGMQQLNLQVKDRFDREGIEFAFPSQTLYLKKDPSK